VRLLADRVGDHSVDADRGEQEGDGGEDSDEQRRVAAHEGGRRVGDDLLHRPHPEDERPRLQRAHLPADGAGQRRRVALRPHQHDRPRRGRRVLQIRVVDDRRHRRIQPVDALVADDADDLDRRAAVAREHEALTDGLLAGEDARGERLVDDDGRRRVLRVALGELAARNQRHAQHAEVAGADVAQVGLRLAARRGHGLPGGVEARGVAAENRHRADRGDAPHAGHGFEAREQLPVEAGDLVVVAVLRGGHGEPEREQVLRVEAGVNFEQPRQTLQHQPRAY
jgi:hypothetical protein